VIRIDAHHHIWELGGRPHAWLEASAVAAIRRDFTLADLAPLTGAAGIDRTVLVQVLPSLAETAEFLALAGESDLVAGVVGWADLTSAAIAETLSALPNVSCKLSGMVTEAGGPGWTVADLRPYAETVPDAFGPSRVMFGSDWPVCLLAASYADVVSAALELTAELTQGELAQVFGGTAVRAYGLPRSRW
jgi:predicted TIM-barrel fold metal-dependent hydrolase